MRLEFLKNISISQFTLPVVSIVALLLWMLLPTAHADSVNISDHGLWLFIPSAITHGFLGKAFAIAFSALAVYLVAELTNTFVLLRISSRMLSSSLALLLACVLCLHSFQPGIVIMTFTAMSFFAMFYTYQLSNTPAIFVAFMLLSLSSLIFPKLLFYVPVYWGCIIYLRSFSARSLMASLFGILVPYWFFFCYALYTEDGVQTFTSLLAQVVALSLPAYPEFMLTDILCFAFVSVFFLAGTINFFTHAFLDKTRTRVIFIAVIVHGVASMLFILLQPQYIHTLLPLFLIDASLVGGHFIALTYNKISHIYALVMLVLLVALLGAQIIL